MVMVLSGLLLCQLVYSACRDYIQKVMPMNDEYIRKDVYDAETDHILSLIDDTNRRFDDMKDYTTERMNDIKDSVSRMLTVGGIVIGILQFGLALMLYVLK